MAEEKKTTKKKVAKTEEKVEKAETEKVEEPVEEVKKTVEETALETVEEVEKTVEEPAKEEIKVEKKFCTNCGKELTNGEECDCRKDNNNQTSINTEKFVNASKGVLNVILDAFKKPLTTIKREVDKNDTTSSIILLVLIAAAAALFVIGYVHLANDAVLEISSYTYGTVSYSAGTNYLKIFIYALIISFGCSLIPALAAYIVARITGNSNFGFTKCMSLYAVSNAPMIFCYAGLAILCYLNILSGIGMILVCIMSVVCHYNFVIGFLEHVNISYDKRSYAITALLVIWIVILLIVAVIFLGSILSDITTSGVLEDLIGY